MTANSLDCEDFSSALLLCSASKPATTAATTTTKPESQPTSDEKIIFQLRLNVIIFIKTNKKTTTKVLCFSFVCCGC